MRVVLPVSIIVGIFVMSNIASAAMTSTNYQILWDALSAGGGDTSESASYTLRDSLGNSAAGESSSTNYQVAAGYRAGIFDQIVKIDMFVQNISSQRAATAFVGLTITTSTTGLAVGDFVALVQDLGLNQVAAVGQIASIGAGTITLDRVTTGGTSPTVDGTNDYLYIMQGTTISLGDTLVDAPKTALVAFEVTADITNGYIVGVVEDGNLRSSAGHDVDDVSDGSVTSANEEYGARSSDTSVAQSTFDTQDTAMTTVFQDIATESDTSFASRNFLTLKVATNPNTVSGTYSQTLSFVLSGNY